MEILIVVMPILGGIVVATSNTDRSTAEGDGCESVPCSTLDPIEEGLTIAGVGSLTSRR